MSSIIHLNDIRKSYFMGNQAIPVLKGINLDIYKNEYVALMGPSGSGKSTLMNILGCLDSPTSGSYILNGKDVSKMADNDLAEVRNKDIGFVFQQFNLLPRLNAAENVALPLVYAGVAKKERIERAMEVLATHRNLLEMVKNGTFREDLYYRVLGLPIHLPALRERENDVLIIAKHFMDNFCKENNLPRKNLSTEAKKKLMGHAFPGNVRELKSVIDLACVMAEEKEIEAEHLNVMSQNMMSDFMLKEATLKEFTIKFIQFYLDKYNYDVLKVARKLDVGKSTIYRMIQNKEVFVNKKFSFEASFMN